MSATERPVSAAGVKGSGAPLAWSESMAKRCSRADLNRLLVVAVHHARAFAQHLDRAGARAAGAQNIGVENGAGRAGKIAAGDLLDEARNIDVRGAGGGAGRIEAVQASVRLGHRSLPVKRRMQIAEARGSLRMDRRLLHKRRWPLMGDILSLLASGEP